MLLQLPGVSLVPYVASGSSLSLPREKFGTCGGRSLLPGVAIDVCSGLAMVCHIVCHPSVGVGCNILYHLGGGHLHHQGVYQRPIPHIWFSKHYWSFRRSYASLSKSISLIPLWCFIIIGIWRIEHV